MSGGSINVPRTFRHIKILSSHSGDTPLPRGDWSCIVRDMPEQDSSQILVVVAIGPAILVALAGALVWWLKSRGGARRPPRDGPPSQP